MSKSRGSLIQSIYEDILGRILSGQLAAGERISEIRLAAELSVSRTPVHTALQQLAKDGLINLSPNSSAHVASYSRQDIHDIGTLRLSLDDMAVRLAMLYGSQSDFLALKKLATDCERGMLTGDDHLRRTADCDFHLLLAKISRNALLLQFQTEMYKRVNFILLTQRDVVVNRSIHVREHFDLIDAIAQHDAKRAHAIITHHLVSFYDLEDQYPPNFFLSGRI